MRLREEMQELNAFLRSQRIELDGIRRSDTTLVRRFSLKRLSDPHCFDLHGRLYGAFWLSLPARRRAGLRINGEPIVDLDLSSLFPRLAYLHVGKECPDGDLYDIPGLDVAEHRGTVKAGLSAMLSSSIPLAHLPRDVSKALPPGWTDKRFIAAVCDRHPDLVPAFGKDLGVTFMLTESRIMIAAALALARHRGIAALLIHDGAMVPASGEEEAREAMRMACLEVVGVEMPVVRKAV